MFEARVELEAASIEMNTQNFGRLLISMNICEEVG
jgi:hypothetical protein